MTYKTYRTYMFFFFLIAILLGFWRPAQAEYTQGNRDASDKVTVTARVNDTTPPTIPVLISPANGSYLKTHLPAFCFKKSTDWGSPVHHYEFWLQGEVFIAELPASQSPVENADFSLTGDAESICFTLKKPLSDGFYTWSIRAYDSYGNFADSAVWSFTVDTVAPFIIITQIEENLNLNLSSLNPESVPAGLTFKTASQEPSFLGKGEPGANMQITLTASEGDKIYRLPLSRVASTGTFSIKPEQKMPRQLYKILVVSTDQAGNTTVLPEFYLLITAPGRLLVPPTLLELPQVVQQLPAFPAEIAVPPNYLPLLTLAFLVLYLILISLGLGLTPCLLALFLWLLSWPFKKRPSVVYDAAGKRNVSFAQIRLFKLISLQGKTLQGEIAEEVRRWLADSQGRFELKLAEGDWLVKAGRPGYLFPSRMVKGSGDGLYQNVYHGELISLQGKTLQGEIAIPLDPDPTCYTKYQRYILLAKLIVLLAVASGLAGLLSRPDFLSLGLFIFCLGLALRTRHIH